MIKEYFIGIDLGTTNSLMAWSKIDTNEKINTEIVDINMMDETGGKVKSKKLPSIVYFGKETPIIGSYAKNMMITRPDMVLKSVKSFMGENRTFDYNKNKYTGSEIQSLILNQMAKSSKNLFGFIPKNVIITVPASFDSDMRKETLEAAEKAGFAVKKTDGSYKNILLDEPRAVIFDFINRHNNGEIPDSLIDLNKPKNILVYDLGGGTLDVSFHKVYYDNKIKIEDYAVSRYTKIGGDNFDELLAKVLLDSFLKDYEINLDDLSEIDKNNLEKKFIQIAEDAKLELSNKIEQNEIFGLENDNATIEILKGNIYDGKIFEYDLSIEKYKQIISPLLSEKLSFDDYKNLDDYTEINNIIYPILDVLNKSKIKLGDDFEIDAVILNGGMTKLKIIQDRIKDFFGFEPLTVLDPDMSVASGASVFHYYTYRGYKPTKIMNDSIGIELAGGIVEHLVPEGTVLPFKSKPIDKFTVEHDGATFIDLPFYMGRRKDTQFPNRKIATRRIKFPKALTSEDKIKLNIEVDEMSMMKINGSINDDKTTHFEVQLLTNKKNFIEEKKVIKKAEIAKKIIDKKPTGKKLKVNKTVEHYINTLNKYKKMNDVRQKKIVINEIKNIEKLIKNSENYKEFIPVLVEKTEITKNESFTRIIQLLGDIMDYYNFSDDKILSKIMHYSSPMRFDFISNYELNTKVRTCIEAIGKSKNRRTEQHLINVIEVTTNLSVIKAALISLGKVGYSINSIKLLEKMIKTKYKNNSFWALGKIASRENNVDLSFSDIKYLKPILLAIFNELQSPEELNNLIYAFGEIFDNRYESNLDERARKEIIKKLIKKSNISKNKLHFNESQSNTFDTRINLAQKMIEGTKLSKSEDKVLLAIRSKLK